MAQPLFSVAGTFPCPLLPYDPKGAERQPDGVQILDLDQAATRWGDPDALKLLWYQAWEEATTPQGDDARARDLAILRRSEFRDLTDQEFRRYLTICQQHDLDPLTRPLYATRRYDERRKKEVIAWRYPINTIRILVQRTGECGGDDGVKLVYGDSDKIPYRATITVYRENKRGTRIPFTGFAQWDEYYPGPGSFFDRMPALKLAYCAEANAWRKAFPEELRDVYAPEEMKQADLAATKETYSFEWDHRRQKPWPGSYYDFNVALSELGLRDELARTRVINQLREEVGVTETEEQYFREALQMVYEQPEKYGVQTTDNAATAAAT